MFSAPQLPMLSTYTAVIYEDRQKNIWIGRDKGVDFIARGSSTARHYKNQPNNPNSLIGNDVNTILQDSRGLFWMGTKDGLSIFNTKTNSFIT